MNINEVRQEKDLRSIPFSDLFYRIFDEQNGHDTAWAIIDRLDPDYKLKQKARLEAAYDSVLDNIGEIYAAHLRGLIGNGANALFKLITAEAEGRDPRIESAEVAIKEGYAPSSPCFREALSENRVLDAISILPHMQSDQDLIVFFGNNFHATLHNIDAYTGLLYSFEFFEYDGKDLKTLVLSEGLKKDKDGPAEQQE